MTDDISEEAEAALSGLVSLLAKQAAKQHVEAEIALSKKKAVAGLENAGPDQPKNQKS